MQFFPSRAVFLQIGNSISIRWYAVCILTGALVAYFLILRQGKKAGYDPEVFDDIFIGCLLFGIIGARLWYCLFFDFNGYFSDPFSIIEIWDGGLAIQGGLFGGLAFVAFYCKMNNYSFIHLIDMIMPYVLLAQASGRWGNFANQEAYGGIVDESYYDGILSFLKEGMYISGQYRQPMFFYESVLCIVGFILIMLYRKYSKSYRGDGLFCYLAWYGVIRFWIESQRTDSLMIGNFRTAQLISIAFMIIGIAGLLGLFRKLIYKDKPTVVFDMDGTLLDTSKVVAASFEHVFAKYIPDYVVTDQDRANFLGPTLKETFQIYVPDADSKMDELIEMYRTYNVEHHKEMVVAFDHVKEVLQFLRNNGYKFSIASSKVKETIKLGLEVAGIDEFFDDDNIVGVDDILFTKPHKETVVKGYQAVGGRLDNAIYVGDSPTDVQAAKNAGVYSIGFVTNMLKQQAMIDSKPNKLIYDFNEIIDILKETDHCWTSNLK